MFISAIKKQTSVCCSTSLYDISNLESWRKKRKRKAILLLAYIADVSCMTNRSFYMRTLSLDIYVCFFSARRKYAQLEGKDWRRFRSFATRFTSELEYLSTALSKKLTLLTFLNFVLQWHGIIFSIKHSTVD